MDGKVLGFISIQMNMNANISILIYCKNVFYSCDGKAEYSKAITLVFSVT